MKKLDIYINYFIIVLIIIIYLCYLTNVSVLEENFTNNIAQLCRNGSPPHIFYPSVSVPRDVEVRNDLSYIDCIKYFSENDSSYNYAIYNSNTCELYSNLPTDFSYTCNEHVNIKDNNYRGLLFAQNYPFNSLLNDISSSNYFDPLLETSNYIINKFKSIDICLNDMYDATDDMTSGLHRKRLRVILGLDDTDCSSNGDFKPGNTSNVFNMSCKDVSRIAHQTHNLIYKPEGGWNIIDGKYRDLTSKIEDLSYMSGSFYDNNGELLDGDISDGYIRNYLYGSGFIYGKGQNWLGAPSGSTSSTSNYFTRLDNSYSNIIQDRNNKLFINGMPDDISYSNFLGIINKTFKRNNELITKSKEYNNTLSGNRKIFTIIFSIIIFLAIILSLYYYNIIELSFIKLIYIILFIIIIIFLVHFYGNLDTIKIIINNLFQ